MQVITALPTVEPVPFTARVIEPVPPSKWELPQATYPDWEDPQIIDIFRHVVWDMLAPGWGDVFGNRILSSARGVCRAWYRAFEILSLVYLPGQECALIKKEGQLDPRIFAIARGIQFKGPSCLPSAGMTPHFYAAGLTSVSIRCDKLCCDAMLGIVNAFVTYEPPVTEGSDPFAGSHVVRERNVPNLRRLQIWSNANGGDVAPLLYWIVQGSRIRELDIDGLAMSGQAMRAIALGLSQCAVFESFSLFSRHMTDACIARMIELPLDRLTSLCIGGCYSDDENAEVTDSIRALYRRIARSDSIEDLEINWFLPLDEALIDFEREVRAKYGNEANGRKHPLKRIWIRNALVRDEGALAVARFLQSGHSQLLQLSLLECAIYDVGVKALVKALKEDKTLKLVDLSDARNDDDLVLFGLAEEALAKNSVLKWLVMKITILESNIPLDRRMALPRVCYSRQMVPHNILTDARWVYKW